MKLSTALNKLKTIKGNITQVDKYINACISHYEDELPEFDYLSEMNTRADLIKEIIKLKTAIQITNTKTNIVYNGQTMSMTELILYNANVRAYIKLIQSQIDHNLIISRYDNRSKEQVKKVFATGYDKKELRKELSSLEIEKEQIDTIMANTNAVTDLVDL